MTIHLNWRHSPAAKIWASQCMTFATVTTAITAAVSVAVATTASAASRAETPDTALTSVRLVLAEFSVAQSWRVDRHPRFLADITGDGRADIVGFGDTGVSTAVSVGDGTFAAPQGVIGDFGYNRGWRVGTHPRFVTDITGDGRADIVGVGDAGVYTAVSLGNGAFATPRFVLSAFGAASRPATSQFFIADMDADGRSDLYQISNRRVDIALARADGTFATPILATTEFGFINGFPFDTIRVADITGDGRAEILAFRTDGPIHIVTARPQGNGTYGRSARAQADTTSGPQLMDAFADVTGDGRADIIAFGQTETGSFSAVSRGNGTFTDFTLAADNFGAGASWRFEHPRFVTDITGDGRADIVGFGDAGVWTADALGTGTFAASGFVLANFGFNQHWRVAKHPRFVTDITGDGRADIVGFGDAGVYIAVTNGQ